MIEAACQFLRERWGDWVPKVGIVLGSGIQLSGEDFCEVDRVPCHEIPGMPVPSVEGHAGEWTAYDHGDLPVLLLGGRVHLYEGHSVEAVTTGMEILAGLGCGKVILTNAAGGIRAGWQPGEVVMIRGHLDFQLQGMITSGGSGDVFDPLWQERIQNCSRRDDGSELAEGIYAGLPGPTYETPAEVQMLRKLGADLVGMSTVQEARKAQSLKMDAVAFSLVTNAAAGTGDSEELNHEEVLQAGRDSRDRVLQVVRRALACHCPDVDS